MYLSTNQGGNGRIGGVGLFSPGNGGQPGIRRKEENAYLNHGTGWYDNLHTHNTLRVPTIRRNNKLDCVNKSYRFAG
jgi:hypothetical protein